MKNYGADPTNAQTYAGSIVLYQHEEQSLMKAMEGLKSLQSARKAFLMVNPEQEKYFAPKGGTVYDEHQINAMIHLVETQLILCRQRIQSMKESFDVLTGLTWAERDNRYFNQGWWVREEDEANGTILLTKED